MAKRELKEINAEYTQVCTALGERTYQQEFIIAEIVSLKKRCKALQDEGSKVLAATAKEAKNEQPTDGTN